MLIRIWKVGLAAGQAPALEEFARTRSLPMFREQPGCLGVFFSRSDTKCATVTLWDSEASVEAMERSAHYQRVVADIMASGFLRDDHRTEVFSIYGGYAGAELTAQLSAAE